jgi:hypothetical protein
VDPVMVITPSASDTDRDLVLRSIDHVGVATAARER